MECSSIGQINILWVGPGMGDIMHHGPWPDAFHHLQSNDLQIKILKLIDLVDKPKLFYGQKYASKLGITQKAVCADFFKEQALWDIIILDFIEAWQLGRTFWPTLRETPFDLILREWELKLKQLSPFQIWVRHDSVATSTIIPMLKPDYRLVVDIQHRVYKDLNSYKSRPCTMLDKRVCFWNNRAMKSFRGLGQDLHVWQKDF